VPEGVKYEIIAAICLFLTGVSCAIFGNLLLYVIVGRINEKVPENQKVSYLGWHPDKYRRVLKEHRRLYPESRSRLYLHLLTWGGFALGIVGFILLCLAGRSMQ
jgi:hypothetical protein